MQFDKFVEVYLNPEIVWTNIAAPWMRFKAMRKDVMGAEEEVLDYIRTMEPDAFSMTAYWINTADYVAQMAKSKCCFCTRRGKTMLLPENHIQGHSLHDLSIFKCVCKSCWIKKRQKQWGLTYIYSEPIRSDPWVSQSNERIQGTN